MRGVSIARWLIAEVCALMSRARSGSFSAAGACVGPLTAVNPLSVNRALGVASEAAHGEPGAERATR